MAITFTTNQVGANADYEKYLYIENSPPTKSSQKNSATLFDFSLVGYDSAFVKLVRGAYITVSSATHVNWFTGYITSNPETFYLGTQAGVATWGYKYEATSDEYILNLSTVGVLPPFIGKTMGYVITYLVNLLAPGVFDVTNINDGLTLANYNVSPDKRFSDVIKDFTESANYVFYANNHKLYFAVQDTTLMSFQLQGNSVTDKNFTPSNLTVRPSFNQIINDCVVVGDIEPQAYVDEYIVGDGFTGSFPLFTGVYGADKYIILSENFGGSSISSQNWTVYDNGNNWLQLYNGYLNVLGGSNNSSFDISLQSTYPILLEGTTRFTHGEFDFITQALANSSTGVIGGLWTQQPNSSFTGCVFGIETFYSSSVFGVRPIINGVAQGSMFQLPDTTGAKRYIFRTTMTCNKQHRSSQTQNYRNNLGVVTSTSVTAEADTIFFLTTVSEVDVITGLLTSSWTWENDNVSLSSSILYATYIPVASNNAKLTVSGITVSLPLHASLDLLKLVTLPNLDFDTWNSNTSPSSWGFNHSVQEETVDVVSGSACKIIATDTAGGDSAAGVTVQIDQYLSTDVTYKMSAKVKRSSNFTVGNITFDISDISGTVFGSGVLLAHGSISSSDYTQISGTFTTGFTTANLTTDAPLYLRVYLGDQSTGYSTGYVVATSYVLVDDIVVYQDWQSLMIGPNDIDNLLGDTTVATINSTNNLPQTITATGNPKYNPGASELVFFKNTELQTSTQPQPNQLYRVSYRAAGNCYGRVQNKSSIASEALSWGDSGIRSDITTNLKPRPRNSRECQIAAATVVGQDGYQHYTGTYTQTSLYLSTGVTPQSVTAVTATNPVVITLAATPNMFSGSTGTLSGFTGAWAAANGSWQITRISSTTFSINLDGTGFGAIAGTAVFLRHIEPIPGTLARFLMLTNLFGTTPWFEEVNSNTSKLISKRPVEIFEYSTSFGEPDYVKRVLNTFAEPKGSYQEYAIGQATDNQIVDITNVGLANVVDVTNPVLSSWDSTSFTIDPNQTAPSGGGFEVRSSDSGWGCDDGNNLITRTATSFTVSRQDKTAAAFIKAYDVRNKLPYSELFVPVTYALASSFTVQLGATVAASKLAGPGGKTFTIGTVNMPNGGAIGGATTVTSSSSQVVSASFSIKPRANAVGKALSVQLYSGASTIISTTAVTLTNGWQRYTVTGTTTGAAIVKVILYNTSGSTYDIDTTQFSIEFGTAIETAYCKTLATPYGALSKFPSVVRISFPPVSGPIGSYANANLTVDTVNTTQFISPPTQVVTVSSSTIVLCDALVKSLTSTADITLNTLPVINKGLNGQFLSILNVGAYHITLPCVTTLAGSSISTGSDIVLAPDGLFDLMYVDGIGWIQASGSGSSFGTSGYTISRYF